VDLDCLSAAMDNALKDPRAYPEKAATGYVALKRMHRRLEDEYRGRPT
jgi:hypothetical protein